MSYCVKITVCNLISKRKRTHYLSARSRELVTYFVRFYEKKYYSLFFQILKNDHICTHLQLKAVLKDGIVDLADSTVCAQIIFYILLMLVNKLYSGHTYYQTVFRWVILYTEILAKISYSVCALIKIITLVIVRTKVELNSKIVKCLKYIWKLE